MKISDRDKKLLLGVLFLAIVLLPIFLFIKPKMEETKSLNTQLEDLNERYNYLKDLYAKKSAYEAQIEHYTEARTALLEGFAPGVLQENTIMFLVDCEEKFNMKMTVLTFSEEEVTHVTDDTVDENNQVVKGLDAYKDSVLVTYNVDYENAKAFLDYIFNNENKMLISNISMDMNESGYIEGSFMFDQFAISGEGRTIESVKIPAFNHGVEMIFPDVSFPEDEEEVVLEENAVEE